MEKALQSTMNGVDLEQLTQTIGAIRENPDIARFQFRARNEWTEGAHSRTTIQTFHGAGREDESRREPFTLDGDEPAVLLGNDRAPNAVESLLHALASCVAVGFVYNAAAQGIRVDSLELELEGDLDLRGFLGLSDEVRPGYQDIRLRYQVDADAPRQKIEELCSYVQRTSPVLDIIRNPVPVKVELTS